MLLSACSRSSFNEELATVDSLITEYNQLKIVVDSMPIKNVKEYFIDYNDFFEEAKKQIVKIETNWAYALFDKDTPIPASLYCVNESHTIDFKS